MKNDAIKDASKREFWSSIKYFGKTSPESPCIINKPILVSDLPGSADEAGEAKRTVTSSLLKRNDL